MEDPRPLRRRWSAGPVLVVASAAAALLGPPVGLAAGATWPELVEGFAVTDSAAALSLTAAAAPVVLARPGHAVGRLLLASGACYAAAALVIPATAALAAAGAPPAVVSASALAGELVWTPAVAVLIPLLLLVFPTGALAHRAWRPVAVLLVVSGPLFAWSVLDPVGFTLRGEQLGPPSWVSAAPGWVQPLSGLRGTGLLLASVALLAWRWVRGDDVVRRQLLWVLVATAVATVAVLLPTDGVDPLRIAVVLPLVPGAIAVAVVRHQLLDIRLVVARGLAYGALAGLAAGVFAASVVLVVLLAGTVSGSTTTVAAAAAVTAAVVAPLHAAVVGRVERALYGQRRDPVAVLESLAPHLSAGRAGLDGAVASLAEVLRLPRAVLVDEAGRVVASSGRSSGDVARDVDGERLALPGGALVVSPRRGQAALSRADRRAVAAISAPLAVALRATELTEQLQRARLEALAARADERERIRQDLHDGLGPALAGIAFSAAAVQRLLPVTPSRPPDGLDDGVDAAAAVAGSIAVDVAAASREVRRIVDGLQPAGLEGRTLVEALRAEAERVGRVPRTAAPGGAQQPLLVDLDLPGGPSGVPPLPEDVEVALYRTAVEALHNAVRHGRAERALVRLRVGERAELEVLDSAAGRHDPAPWEAGTGLRGIARRTAELGGTWWAGPTQQGGRVVVDVPLLPPEVAG